ncbi:MAG: hypothetical protein ACK6DM_03800, partial [Alphaproteobacteria bacterium]
MSALPLEQGTGHFEAIERAIRQTPRGGAFLEEFERRVRSSDTDRILNALGDLRQTLTQKYWGKINAARALEAADPFQKPEPFRLDPEVPPGGLAIG